MIEVITRINDAINGVVWGWPALILLGFVGVFMTILTLEVITSGPAPGNSVVT